MTKVKTFRARDEMVISELTASRYHYGAGRPGYGVQLLIRRDMPRGDELSYPYQTLRLTRETAAELALWILQAVDP